MTNEQFRRVLDRMGELACDIADLRREVSRIVGLVDEIKEREKDE